MISLYSEKEFESEKMFSLSVKIFGIRESKRSTGCIGQETYLRFECFESL